jgi:hypothetical protein
MAMNSFHKYVSAIRKSKSFKPVYIPHPLGLSGRVVAKRNETLGMYCFTSQRIIELQEICGDGLVITADDSREMYAYDMWL